MNVAKMSSPVRRNRKLRIYDFDTTVGLQMQQVQERSSIARNARETNQFNTLQVFWNLTVVLQSLTYVTADTAFDVLTAQISAMTITGELAARLTSLDRIYTNVTITNVFFSSLPPTMMPTLHAATDSSSSAQSPLSTVNLVAVVVGSGFGLCICAAFYICMIRRTSVKKAETINHHIKYDAGKSLPISARRRRLNTLIILFDFNVDPKLSETSRKLICNRSMRVSATLSQML